ncbi:MAG TPA: acyl-CoA reductase [Myxococcota bacterium]|nr:acyl-CoA reductase [Myxococcota bacterium]
MNAESVRARMHALREAGARLRARAPSARLATLARALDRWSDPQSSWRRKLESKLPAATGFAPETVRRGLAIALADWNGAALERLAERELGALRAASAGDPAFPGFELCAVVLAGAIPMPTLKAIVAPLVLGTPVLVKPASRDPVTAELVARSLAELDPEVGACVALAPLSRSDADAQAALLESDCVVVYGDDATVSSLAARATASRRFVGHGHRLSLAAFGPEVAHGETLAVAAAGLAQDVALWDQLGCLSPVALYAVGDARACDRIAESVAAGLAEASSRWPRGEIDAASAARFAHARADAELRAASGTGVSLYADRDGGWCVVREVDAEPRPAPLHRFLRVHPVADARALAAAIAPHARHLAGVALAGFGAQRAELARSLRGSGATYVCAPGSLQAPPLEWESEGRGVLASLARPPSSRRAPSGSLL